MSDEGFLTRVFAMPFRPGLWSRAARWRSRDVILPLLVLALLTHGALGVLRTWQAYAEASRWIDRYDSSHPAVTIAGGRVSVEGDQVIRFEEDGKTFLVDPLETVPLESIRTREYIVVREREIIQKRPLRKEVIRVADMQEVFGDPLRIDGASLRALRARLGVPLAGLLFGFMLLFLLVRDSLGALVFSSVAAGLTARARTAEDETLAFGQRVNVALAAYSVLLLLHAALNLLGTAPGACLGAWLWPAILTGLVYWRVRGVTPEPTLPRLTPPQRVGSTTFPSLTAPQQVASTTGMTAGIRRSARLAPARSSRVGLVLGAAAAVALIVLAGALVAYRRSLPRKAEAKARELLASRFGSAFPTREMARQVEQAAHPACFEKAFELRALSSSFDARGYTSCLEQAAADRLAQVLTLHSPEIWDAPDARWWRLAFLAEGSLEEVPEQPVLRITSDCQGEKSASEGPTSRDFFERVGERRYRVTTQLYKHPVSCRHEVVLAHGRWPLGPPLQVVTQPPVTTGLPDWAIDDGRPLPGE